MSSKRELTLAQQGSKYYYSWVEKIKIHAHSLLDCQNNRKKSSLKDTNTS
jgi:hypothetical protein